jgi:hypothetical protein
MLLAMVLALLEFIHSKFHFYFQRNVETLQLSTFLKARLKSNEDTDGHYASQCSVLFI